VPIVLAAVASLLLIWPSGVSTAAENESQVCDVDADYYLGIEDYSEAIRRHILVVRAHPANALVHYHLGFALGMVGDKIGEVKEYRVARALGLKVWDLFLNLGLAELEEGGIDAATDSLRLAVLFGPDHSESHFNLALVEAQRGMLSDAEHEALESLRLNPEQPDALNLLAVIYSRENPTERGSLLSGEVVREAGSDLSRGDDDKLGGVDGAADGGTTALVPHRGPSSTLSANNNRAEDTSQHTSVRVRKPSHAIELLP
jgi:tetratricopeptide (TPR) repeat protein